MRSNRRWEDKIKFSHTEISCQIFKWIRTVPCSGSFNDGISDCTKTNLPAEYSCIDSLLKNKTFVSCRKIVSSSVYLMILSLALTVCCRMKNGDSVFTLLFILVSSLVTLIRTN